MYHPDLALLQPPARTPAQIPAPSPTHACPSATASGLPHTVGALALQPALGPPPDRDPPQGNALPTPVADRAKEAVGGHAEG
eukprot:4346797-Pyramimonas_sp.AAC.1